MDRPRTILRVLVAALAVASCAGEGGSGPQVTTRDSAGARIVEHSGVSDLPAGWSVSSEPIFRIGWAEGDPQFQSVRSGLLDDAGRLIVADQGSSHIYGLSPDGVRLWMVGGPGQGPGQFGRIGTVVALPEDSILVSDGGNGRVTVFHGEKYAFDRRFRTAFSEALYDPAARTADGSFLLTPHAFALGLDQNAGWRSYPLLTTGDFVDVDTLAVVPMLEMNASGDLNPIRHAGAVVVTGGRVATGRSDRAEITWRNTDGRVTQIVRWDESPRAVREDDWPAYEAAYRERLESRYEPERLEQNLRDMREDFGGTVPLFRFVHGDSEGNVWLGEYRMADPNASVYRVVSHTGEWVGSIGFPRDIRILDITDTRVLGVETNELDVQAVVLYELVKPDA